MPHARQHRLRRATAYAALAMMLGVVSLTLSQCRAVGDKTTGVQLFRGNATSCIKDCNDQYKLLFDQEQKLHATNVENCQALSQPDRGACLAAEDARHTAAMVQLGDDKTNCQNTCHGQGGG